MCIAAFKIKVAKVNESPYHAVRVEGLMDFYKVTQSQAHLQTMDL